MNYYCKLNYSNIEGAVAALKLKGGHIVGSIPFDTYKENLAYIDAEDSTIKYTNINQFTEHLLSRSAEWEEVQPIEVTFHTVKVYRLPDDYDKYTPDEVKRVACFLGHDPDGKYEIRLADHQE